MKKVFSIIVVFALSLQVAISQSNPDDFWLNNGFTNGQTVTTNSGFFYDDGGNDVYHENQDWTVTFCSENGNPITLDFSGFKTHFGGTLGDGTYLQYDYMTVDYPGAGGGYYVYYNDTPEFSFTSQSGCMDFGFHSDGDGMIDSGWVAEIFAVPPPFNNDPADAEVLTVGNVCSPSFYTNKGAYNTTGLGSPPCKTYFGGDVWFTLIVPPSGVVKVETFAGTLTYAILDIFRSANSTILSSERIACVDDGGAMPSVTLTSPTVNPGDRLYIRVFGEQAKSGLFGICATDPTAPVTGYTGPGGVGDSISLDYWFKPDVGVLDASDSEASDTDPVKTWQDQSGNNMHLIQTDALQQPVFHENVVNNFGAIKFDGSNDLFSLESGSGDAPLNWFVVGSFIGSQRQSLLSIGDALPGKTASLSRHSDGRYYSFTTSDNYGPALADGQYYVFHASHKSSNPYHFLQLDGLNQTVTADAVPLETDGSLQVGASWDNSDPFNGQVSEIIQYRKTLNSAQEIIVNNYLSAKYDIDLDASNYYAFKNSYHFDVAGIGRVNASNTHTKAESADILAVSGADDLGDNEFLFLGHDNGDFTTWSSANVPMGDTNIVRLNRVWRISLVGDPGDVSFELAKDALPSLPVDFVAYNILIDADGDFSSGAQSYGPFEISDQLIVNNVAVSHGDYVAVAAVRPVVSFSSAANSELESVANPVIQVVLNYAISDIVEVAYSVIGSTAVQGTDYSLLPGSVFINPGTKSVNIVPLIIDDAQAEIPDEYFDIQISTPTSGVIAAGNTVLRHTILNDDLELTITASDTIIGECPGSESEIVVTPLGTGPFTYSWTPLSGLDVYDNDTVIAQPAVTTTYTVQVTDFFGSSKTENIEIEVLPAPGMPSVTVNGSSSICDGDSVKLSAPAGYAAYLWSDGSTADSLWVSASGNYNLIVSDSFACSSPVSNDVSITVNPLPSAPVLTPDGPLTFCDGDSVVLGATTGYASYLWSDNSSNDSLTVKSSGDYYLSVQDVNGCSSANSDTITVLVFSNPSQPVVTLSGDPDFCDGDSIKLSAPAGFSSYAWNSGQTSNEIYVSTAGDYNVSVTDANACVSLPSADATITVYSIPAAPVISPSGPISFCDGANVTLNSSGSFSVYTWNDGTNGPNRIISSPGEYSVKGEDGNGCVSPLSDTITVTVFSLPGKPSLTLVGSNAFCNGDSSLLVAPSGFTDYLWSDGSTNDTLIVKSSGNYSLVVSDDKGCDSPESDQQSITVFANPGAPLISADGPTTFCQGDSVSLSVPSGYSGYTWSNGDVTEELIAKSNGSYSVFVEDANGCFSPSSLPVIVTVNSLPAAPTINPDGPVAFCEGGSVLLQPTGSFLQYEWNDGTIIKDRLADASGDYSVRVTDANGCLSDFSVSIAVTEYPLPDKPLITPSSSLTFCEGDSVILSAPAGFDAYNWSDGSTGEQLIVYSSGTFNVAVTDANSCISELSDDVSALVNANPAAPVLLASGDTEFCEGGSVDLDATPGFNIYYWSDGGSGASRTINVSDTYTVSGEDGNGCLSPMSNAIEVRVNQAPDKPAISPSGPVYVLTGDSIELSAPISDAYLWSPGGETSSSIWVKASGDYSVLVSNSFGCQSLSSDLVSVTVSDFLPPPVITIGGSTEFCEGEAVLLSGPEGFAVYSWSNGSGGQQLSVTSSETITLVVTDANGYSSFPSDPVTITVYELPVLTLKEITEPQCTGSNNGSITTEASGGTAPYNYSWTGESETNATLSSISAGEYTSIVTDAQGCSVSLLVQLTEPQPINVDVATGAAYCPDFSDGSLQLNISGGTEPYSVAWDEGSSGETLSNLAPGDYSFTVTDANNCQFESNSTITYKNDVCFIIPEIITPNNDGWNDTWRIDGLEVYPDVTVEVFDRWGKRVFFSEGQNTFFDGTFNGKELPMESYHYVIDLHNGSERLVGNITIIR